MKETTLYTPSEQPEPPMQRLSNARALLKTSYTAFNLMGYDFLVGRERRAHLAKQMDTVLEREQFSGLDFSIDKNLLEKNFLDLDPDLLEQ